MNNMNAEDIVIMTPAALGAVAIYQLPAARPRAAAPGSSGCSTETVGPDARDSEVEAA
jgi:hypothetical protein